MGENELQKITIQNDWEEHFKNESISEQVLLTESEPTLDLFEHYLERGKGIADLGCGLGKHLIYWHRKGFQIEGIDENEKLVEMIKAFDNTVNVETGNILSIRRPDEYFDFVISYGVLEHFEDGPLPAMLEMNRVMKIGGTSFISVPLKTRTVSFLLKVKQNRVLRKIAGKAPLLGTQECRLGITEIQFGRNEFHCLLNKAGFEVIEERPILGRWCIANLSKTFRGKRYPKNPTYSVVLSPPLSMLGRVIFFVVNLISPWSIGHFQFFVAKKLKSVP